MSYQLHYALCLPAAGRRYAFCDLEEEVMKDDSLRFLWKMIVRAFNGRVQEEKKEV